MRGRKHASLLRHEQRQPHEEAARAAISAREGESGAEGDHNRSRGSALADGWCSPRHPNRKSRAGLVTETRVSPHPGSQKKSHSDEAGLRLGQEGKSAGQDQRGMWPGTEELQRSSRDKMQRLSLNAAPEEKKTQQEECLRRGFSWLFTGAWSKAPVTPQQSYPGDGQPTPYQGRVRRALARALGFSTRKHQNARRKSVYSSIKQYAAAIRKYSVTEKLDVWSQDQEQSSVQT